jgi:LPXTG-motif cell wall-anchored protein
VSEIKTPNLTAGETKSNNGFLFGGLAVGSAAVAGVLYFVFRKKF